MKNCDYCSEPYYQATYYDYELGVMVHFCYVCNKDLFHESLGDNNE